MAGIGLIELAGGALIVLGIFAAFMVWAIFPLLPFIIAGVFYGAVRYGVPALARGAVVAEHAVVGAVRRALRPVATWALHEPAPVQARRR
jgi:hypothetical protein